MKIAVIGGGAAGMVTAYYLDGQFDVTVFEKQWSGADSRVAVFRKTFAEHPHQHRVNTWL